MVDCIHYGLAHDQAEYFGEKRWWSRAVHSMTPRRRDRDYEYEHMPVVVGFFCLFYLLHAGLLPTLRLCLPSLC